ncbi:putative proline-rich early nodulin protein [Phaeoacremonium minimum UCRPA7]|uniref:Putative proline-rich early nodulin protein n=1 Tax=Phaeoacremonium minimum (strain UCR-PA7) TaxID=1286976 RepID=R8BBL6_PHAM7|nr:putative proline-rich early nodulin protein [Phaeoacremonium minimum UCRPA7]EON96677.1 putative proline-rich early nodulin protein [Phaeoacremonium minimum UCRPA7]
MAPQDDSGASVASSALSSPPESIVDPKEDIDTLISPVTHENSGIAEQLEKIGVSTELPKDNSEDPEPSIEVNMDGKRPHRAAFNKTTTSTAKKPKMRSKKWDPDFLLEDPASALTKVDLRALLSHPDAWTVLTAQEKKEILAKFPDEQHILNAGTEDACPNIQSLRNDDNFRHDVARFQDAIANGQLDPQWLQEAWIAHERRETGEFDEFKIKKFESDWGVELPVEYKLAKVLPPQQSEMPTTNYQSEAPDELSGEVTDVNSEVIAKGADGNISEAAKPVETMGVDSTENA